MAVAIAPEPVQMGADWPYDFEVIELEKLFVDKRYQRPLTSFWQTVRDEFNPAQVGTLVVAPRKHDRYAVIDGQTRVEAMRELGIPAAPCLVYTELSHAQEAKLFADLQTKRRGMRSYDRFRAQLVAKDKRALAISQIVTAEGFALGVDEEPDTMRAIGALERLYKRAPEHLEQVLRIVRIAWGTDDVEARSAEIVRGLSWFLLNQDEVSEERLISRLSEVTPGLLRHRASALREGKLPGSGSGLYMGQAILNLYVSRR
jgi:hypothetical protein